MLLWSHLAQAPTSASGHAVLADLDRYLAQVHDQTATLDLRIEDNGGLPRTYKIALSLGYGHSLMTVEQPADWRGLRVLNVASHQTYVIAPMLYRSRRIAGQPHAPLFGSSFSYADFVNHALADYFEAVVVPVAAEKAILRADAKRGIPAPYPRLEFDFNPTTYWISEIRYYDAEHRIARTETREEPLCDRNICVPGKRRMVDHRRADLASEVRVTDLKINAGIDERQFSLNAMKHFY